MSKEQICSICGNTENNHYFRHSFDGSAHVEIKSDRFILDADEFPTETIVICGEENCSRPEKVHGVELPEEFCIPDCKDRRIIKHEFKPKEKRVRKIKFVIPPSTKCRWDASKRCKKNCRCKLSHFCYLSAENHDTDTDHPFTTQVIIKNRREDDEIHILHPDDEDIKILWEIK